MYVVEVPKLPKAVIANHLASSNGNFLDGVFTLYNIPVPVVTTKDVLTKLASLISASDDEVPSITECPFFHAFAAVFEPVSVEIAYKGLVALVGMETAYKVPRNIGIRGDVVFSMFCSLPTSFPLSDFAKLEAESSLFVDQKHLEVLRSRRQVEMRFNARIDALKRNPISAL